MLCREPVVLPYYHTGMGAVMPFQARLPRVGHNVTVTFGDPVPLADVTCQCNKKGVDQRQVWRTITKRVEASLQVCQLCPAPASALAVMCVPPMRGPWPIPSRLR